MIYYDSPNPAPNPRRVRIFAAEKGIELPTQMVSITAREQKSPEFMALNPRGQTPALQLDDGMVIAESIAICRYLEALHPAPSLFGATPAALGTIEMWCRRIEMVVMEPVGKIWVHTHPYTERLGLHVHKEYGEWNRPRLRAGYKMCETALAETAFIAGADYSIADIILLTTVDFATFIGEPLPADMPHLTEWHARVTARPSSAA